MSNNEHNNKAFQYGSEGSDDCAPCLSPTKREDVTGTIVELKYCEVCGKQFLRPQGETQAACTNCSRLEPTSMHLAPSLIPAVALGVRLLESEPDSKPKPTRAYLVGDLFRMTCLAANAPSFDQADAKKRWPWLAKVVAPPCACENLITPHTALLVLQHLYDTHVQLRQDWSAEDLIRWVRQQNSGAAGAPPRCRVPHK